MCTKICSKICIKAWIPNKFKPLGNKLQCFIKHSIVSVALSFLNIYSFDIFTEKPYRKLLECDEADIPITMLNPATLNDVKETMAFYNLTGLLAENLRVNVLLLFYTSIKFRKMKFINDHQIYRKLHEYGNILF